MATKPFDLELAIDTWRHVFEKRRSIFKDDLEELELHLRENIAHLMQQGLSEEEAFRKAKAHIGNVVLLDEAFKDVFWRKLKHQNLLLKTLLFQFSMFKNYVKIALRNLIKHKGYSVLNISGLAVGLACSFFIFLWAQDEMSIDRFHENGDRLYQVKINTHDSDQISTWTNAPLPLAEAITSNYPEVSEAILKLPVKVAIRHEEGASHEIGYYASPAFFTAFTFPFIEGDPSSSLDDPTSIVISESVARKHFGFDWRRNGSVLGQSFTMDYWQSNGGVLGEAITVQNDREFTVTGVFEDVTARSTLQFGVVLPVQEVVRHFDHVTRWGPRWFELMVLLEPGADATALSAKIRPVLQERLGEDAGPQDVVLQPFRDTYLHGAFVQGRPAGGRIQRVYLIGLVGLAILLIACINFTNLVTARSNQRAREIGVRKAMGATPSFLVQQFLGEAILTSLVAFVVAAGLMAIAMPLFNGVTGAQIMLGSLTTWNWAAFLGISLLTGAVAGSYPAFYLSSLNVVRVFRSQSAIGKRGEISARKSLVVIQFAVSVFLIVGTLTIYQQLRFFQTKDLGLDKENVVVVRLDGEMNQRYEAVRQSLLESPIELTPKVVYG